MPHYAFFGQKDYQQCVVIKRMVKDLNFPVKIKMCPIVREKDGLALSSRNKYLNKTEREQALVLKKSLDKAKELIENGMESVSEIKNSMKDIINSAPDSKIDYIEIVDPDTLTGLKKVQQKNVVALAVFIGNTRLIDNMVIEPPVS
jgi:pantoate--beta-alanine ligase